MSPTKNPGRFAGLLYLLTSIVGFFAMGYVPRKLLVHGNAAATASNIAALALVRGADFLSIFEKPQREALAMLCLNLHHHGIVVAEIFWGLWLFPLALLVYRSRFLPRLLGVWLALAGVAWVILSLTGVLLPQYQNNVDTYSQPAFFGEIAFMLWLLIKGAKPPALDPTTSSSAFA